MTNGWTPARRARQAILIKTWAPWSASTGPRTAEGKARSSRNARIQEGSVRSHIRELTRGLK